MKRPLIILAALCLPFLACVTGLFLSRDSLSVEALADGRVLGNPADAAFELRFPVAAWPMPDGGYAVLDDEGRRIVRLDAQAVYRWSIGEDLNFGSFLSVDSDGQGLLYVMDTGPAAASGDGRRLERIVRVGADGLPAGTVVQKAFSGDGGFIRGSLRIAEGSAWYLFAGDDGLVSLARTDLSDGRERVLVKTEWALSRASLAPRGQDVYVSAGGGLVLWSAGRFQSFPEHGDELPYPGELRFGADGALYVSDSSRGVLARIAADGSLSVVLDSEALGQASVRPVGIVFDAFHVDAAGFTIVDQSSSMIMSVQPDGRVSRMIRTATWPEAGVRAQRRAWLYAAGAAVSALAMLALGVVVAASRGPAILGALALGIPVLALAGTVAVAWTGSSRARAAAAFEESSLSRLRAAAVAGAAAIDADSLAAVDGPSDYGTPEWEAVRKSLLAIAERTPSDGSLPMYALLYRERDGALRFICDARGDYRPGLPQRYAFPEYRRVLREASPDTGIIADPSGSWFAAMAPVKAPDGTVMALLELSVPRPEPDRGGALPVLAIIALALVYAASVAGAWFLLSRRAKARAAPAVSVEGEAATSGDGPETGQGESRQAEAGDEPPAAAQSAMALPERTPAREPEPGYPGAGPSGRKHGNALHRQAVEALKAGDPATAARLLEEVVEADPGNRAALNNLGIAYKRSGRTADAVAALERCLALDPGNAEARRNLERVRASLASGA